MVAFSTLVHPPFCLQPKEGQGSREDTSTLLDMNTKNKRQAKGGAEGKYGLIVAELAGLIVSP